MTRVKCYSTVQAAKLLRIGRDTLYRWLRAGKVAAPPVQEVGGVRVRLWGSKDIEHVRKYVAKHYWEGRGRPPKSAKEKRR